MTTSILPPIPTEEGRYEVQALISTATQLKVTHPELHSTLIHSLEKIAPAFAPDAYGRYNAAFFLSSEEQDYVYKHPVEHRRHFLLDEKTITNFLQHLKDRPDFQDMYLPTLFFSFEWDAYSSYTLLQETCSGDEVTKEALIAHPELFSFIERLHVINAELAEKHQLYLDTIGWNSFYTSAIYTTQALLPEITPLCALVEKIVSVKSRILHLLSTPDTEEPTAPVPSFSTAPSRPEDISMTLENLLFTTTFHPKNGTEAHEEITLKMPDLIPFALPKENMPDRTLRERLIKFRTSIASLCYTFQEEILFPVLQLEMRLRSEQREAEFAQEIKSVRGKILKKLVTGFGKVGKALLHL